MKQPSPLPWVVETGHKGAMGGPQDKPYTSILTNTGKDSEEVIADLPHGCTNTEANAALIVRTVNTHSILLTAARVIVKSLTWEENRSGITYQGIEDLRAAIKKATV